MQVLLFRVTDQSFLADSSRCHYLKFTVAIATKPNHLSSKQAHTHTCVAVVKACEASQLSPNPDHFSGLVYNQNRSKRSSPVPELDVAVSRFRHGGRRGSSQYHHQHRNVSELSIVSKNCAPTVPPLSGNVLISLPLLQVGFVSPLFVELQLECGRTLGLDRTGC